MKTLKALRTPTAQDWIYWIILVVGYGGWFCYIMQAYSPR